MTNFVSDNENFETRLSPEKVQIIAKKVVQTHNQIEGSTVNNQGESMLGRSFYAVAIFPERTVKVKARKLLEETVAEFAEANRDLLSYSVCTIGTWYSEEDDISWLDISVIVKDESAARKLGNEYNQIAIFDLLNEKVIELEGDGDLQPEKIALSEVERLRSIIENRGE